MGAYYGRAWPVRWRPTRFPEAPRALTRFVGTLQGPCFLNLTIRLTLPRTLLGLGPRM